MTEHDERLLDLATSTTYRSSIREYIEQAETEECRRELREILDDPCIEWED